MWATPQSTKPKAGSRTKVVEDVVPEPTKVNVFRTESDADEDQAIRLRVLRTSTSKLSTDHDVGTDIKRPPAPVLGVWGFLSARRCPVVPRPFKLHASLDPDKVLILRWLTPKIDGAISDRGSGSSWILPWSTLATQVGLVWPLPSASFQFGTPWTVGDHIRTPEAV